MKTKLFTRTALVLAIAGSLLVTPAQNAPAQNVTDEIQVLRGLLKADRQTLVAESMQLSESESTAFWPLYRDYRAEMDKIGDGIVKLVLEYADAYPDLAEVRAEKMLKEYLALEKASVSARARHLKKMTKVLPNSKVLRFAQVENRLDLALRLRMASVLPLAPDSTTKP